MTEFRIPGLTLFPFKSLSTGLGARPPFDKGLRHMLADFSLGSISHPFARMEVSSGFALEVQIKFRASHN